MKTLVAYYSKSGNTRKVAEAIYAGLDGEKELQPLAAVASLEGYDLAFLGFPVMGQGPDKKTAEFLARHCVEGRRIVIFLTHASPEGSPEALAARAKFREAARGASLVDTFDCQGQLARGVKFMMGIMPSVELRRWAREDTSQGQPDATRLACARVFAQQVLAGCAVAV